MSLRQFHQYANITDINESNNKIGFRNVATNQPGIITIPVGSYTMTDLTTLLRQLYSGFGLVVYQAQTRELLIAFTQTHQMFFRSADFESEFWRVLGLPSKDVGLQFQANTPRFFGPVRPQLINEMFINLKGVNIPRAGNLDNLRSTTLERSSVLAVIPLTDTITPFAYFANTDAVCRDPGILLSDKHLTHIHITITDRHGKVLSYVGLTDYMLVLRVETIEFPNATSIMQSDTTKSSKDTTPFNFFRVNN